MCIGSRVQGSNLNPHPPTNHMVLDRLLFCLGLRFFSTVKWGFSSLPNSKYVYSKTLCQGHTTYWISNSSHSFQSSKYSLCSVRDREVTRNCILYLPLLLYGEDTGLLYRNQQAFGKLHWQSSKSRQWTPIPVAERQGGGPSRPFSGQSAQHLPSGGRST